LYIEKEKESKQNKNKNNLIKNYELFINQQIY
jgi:hypothetical protein